LQPLALVALSDELRPEARTVLEHLAHQGIAFKVISGDHPETVRATIRSLSVESSLANLRTLAELPVVTGAELESAKDSEELILQRTVFGRINPPQKMHIVETLQRHGRFVAMIGDGVNDVLPIKHAHLGIAMGEGSRAAKTVSGLVLDTNDFTLLPQTLEEGRTILRNLRRSSKLFLTKNIFTLILVIGALGFLGVFPFLPQQVTLLNLLTIGVPAFLITLSKEQSPAPSRPRFLREVGLFVLRTGLVIGLAGFVILYLSNRVWHNDLTTQRTLLLSTLVLLGIGTLVRSLTDGEDRGRRADRRFLWLAGAVLPLYLLAMYWPASAWYHELTPLTAGQWIWVVALAGGAFVALRVWDKLLAKAGIGLDGDAHLPVCC
jgi:magnesium-transporting ATPase (P-type)